MDELLNNIVNSTYGKILLIAGILLIVIAAIGKYKEVIQVDKYGRLFSAIIGLLLLFLGIYFNVPEKGELVSKAKDSIGHADSAAMEIPTTIEKNKDQENPFPNRTAAAVPIEMRDEEEQAATTPTFSINDTRASIKFFESDGENSTPANQREYKNQFPKNSRFIYYELTLVSEKIPDRAVNFTIRKAYYNSFGQNLCPDANDFASTYPKSARSQVYWGGWGFQNGWTPGTYTAVIFIDGVEKVRKEFYIID